MNTINIILVDDVDLFRFGVRMSIELDHPDIEVVGEAKTGADFFELFETVEAVDIVLLDIGLPDMSGVDIARRLRTERPEIKILAITADNSTSTIEKMLKIGVEGFVNKTNSNNDTPVEAIRSIMQGLEYFGRDISAIISRIFLVEKKNAKAAPDFTEQEKRIIEYCHEGLPAKLIADRLGISLRTVDWHKSNIFRKFGINNTAELVRYGLKKGIIRAE